MRTRLLPRWEAGGWRLTEAVEALWRGTTDEAALCSSIDRASANVVRLMLASDDEASDRPRFRALRPQSVTRSDDPSSRGVGRLAPGDIVTAVDGRRVVITSRGSGGSPQQQITRLRIGENRWVTEKSTNGPVLLGSSFFVCVFCVCFVCVS